MTDPRPLSPAAKAVLDAAYLVYEHHSFIGGDRHAGAIAAAALRAVADAVVPQRDEPLYATDADRADWSARDDVRDDLLHIANELELRP